jgi:hypothetical protein
MQMDLPVAAPIGSSTSEQVLQCPVEAAEQLVHTSDAPCQEPFHAGADSPKGVLLRSRKLGRAALRRLCAGVRTAATGSAWTGQDLAGFAGWTGAGVWADREGVGRPLPREDVVVVVLAGAVAAPEFATAGPVLANPAGRSNRLDGPAAISPDRAYVRMIDRTWSA